MIPWEKEIYVTLLQQYVEEENLKAQQQNGNQQPNIQGTISNIETETNED